MKVHWGLTCWHSLGFKALVKLSCSSWPWIFPIKFPSLSIFACAYFKRFILLATQSAFNKKRREILGAGSKFERFTIMVKHLRVERKDNLLFIQFKVLTFPTIFFSDLIMPPNSSEDSLSNFCFLLKGHLHIMLYSSEMWYCMVVQILILAVTSCAILCMLHKVCALVFFICKWGNNSICLLELV